MWRASLTATVLAAALAASATGAIANSVADCNQSADLERTIRGCTQMINANNQRDIAYNSRGLAHANMGDLDQAISDYTKAIEINPKYNKAYNNRGIAYVAKGELDRAISDYNRAIEINPKSAHYYTGRGIAYMEKGDYDRAVSDFNRAMQIDPKNADPHTGLGRLHLRKGDYDRAIAELSEAMRLAPKDPEPVADRGAAYEAAGQIERAVLDYRVALALPAKSSTERKAHAQSRERLAAIESRARPTAPKPIEVAIPKPAVAVIPGRRVALVIGNANYANAGRLTNPANDGRAIAASLRRLGFAEVVERYDLGQVAMGRALKEFGDKAAGAEWAVVYYAGHGIEVSGTGYLIPVDAKLERDTHVDDETVPLARVLDKVGTAQKLRLVILDACRNNPFVSRMVRTAANRSIGRGLSQIEPEGGVLVAYAAKHGTTADDGVGANSPFAEALLAYLEEPGLEINFLFRKVRDQVMKATAKRQEPYLYGSLPSESLYFRSAEAR